jgi:hypothetical protein
LSLTPVIEDLTVVLPHRDQQASDDKNHAFAVERTNPVADCVVDWYRGTEAIFAARSAPLHSTGKGLFRRA